MPSKGPSCHDLCARFLGYLNEIHVQWQTLTHQPTHRQGFDRVLALRSNKLPLSRIDPEADVFPGPGMIDSIRHAIDRDGAIRAHLADVALPIQHLHPPIRVNGGGERWPWREPGEGDARRLVPTC